MHSSRDSSTSENESVADNDVSCEESISNKNYHHYVSDPQVRYLINDIINDQKIKEANLLPPVTAFGPQFILDNGFGYRTYSYAPPSYARIHPNIPPFHQQQILHPTNKPSEFVSIRYFAPAQNKKLMKGDLPRIGGGVQYVPGTMGVNDKRFFSTESNFFYNPKPSSSMQQFNDAISQRVVNLESSQYGIDNQSFVRPVSSLWNLTGGADNEDRFLTGNVFDNPYESNLNPRRTFSKNYSNQKNDRKYKKYTKVALITGAISVVMVAAIIATILSILLPKGVFINTARSAESVVSSLNISNTSLVAFNSTIAGRVLTETKIDQGEKLNLTTTTTTTTNDSLVQKGRMITPISNISVAETSTIQNLASKKANATTLTLITVSSTLATSSSTSTAATTKATNSSRVDLKIFSTTSKPHTAKQIEVSSSTPEIKNDIIVKSTTIAKVVGMNLTSAASTTIKLITTTSTTTKPAILIKAQNETTAIYKKITSN